MQSVVCCKLKAGGLAWSLWWCASTSVQPLSFPSRNACMPHFFTHHLLTCCMKACNAYKCTCCFIWHSCLTSAHDCTCMQGRTLVWTLPCGKCFLNCHHAQMVSKPTAAASRSNCCCSAWNVLFFQLHDHFSAM